MMRRVLPSYVPEYQLCDIYDEHKAQGRAYLTVVHMPHSPASLMFSSFRAERWNTPREVIPGSQKDTGGER